MIKKEIREKQKGVSIFNIKDQTQIKNKILLLILASIVAIVLLTTAVAIGMFYKSTMDTVRTFMSDASEIAANNVKATIEAKLTTVEEFASGSYFVLETRTDQETITYCNEFAERQGYLSALYTDQNGIALDGIDFSERAYFQECKSTLQPAISDPLVSKELGTTVVVLAAPIIKNRAFAGLIIVQAEANFLSELTTSTTIGETGRSYMLNAAGTTIAHYDEEQVLNSINAIEMAAANKELAGAAAVQSQMITGRVGADVYRYQGVQKILGYAPIGVNGWSIGLCGNTSEFLLELYLSIALILVLAIISILFVVAYVTKYIKKLILPLQLCSDRIVLLGEGDLSTEFPRIETKDEIGVTAVAAEKMMYALRSMITDVDHMLGEMADGNFDIRSKAESSYQGDFAGLLTSIKKLNHKLTNTLLEINDASEQVAIGSAQMADSAQVLAVGATEQAGAIEELTATILDVASSTQESALMADGAYNQAKEFVEQAQHGSEEMEELTRAMERIIVTSKNIENIITEIEDIASQTNLLSLNASIEAARAGEAGRGFAVVADQIGKLASDSAKSAVNTRELIGKSIEEIDNGNHITTRTAEALKTVTEGIKMLAGTSKETSRISKSQSETMKQIEQGIEQISEVVQGNSASAEETSATSEELLAQSESLKELAGQFTLNR